MYINKTQLKKIALAVFPGLLVAGIIWSANMYYDIDAGKIIVNEVQRIIQNLEVSGTTKLGDGGTTNYAQFSNTGDLSFVGTADTISKTDGTLNIQATTGALALTGSTNSAIDFPNFDVATTGHITVQPAYGLDVNGAGELKLGDTTATTVSIGSTAATTLNLGADGALARTINIGTGTGIDTIKIGTGGTGADDIDIGDALADVDVTGASQIVAGTGDALTITGNAASTWSTSAGLLTITGTGGVTIDTASGNAININAVGANLNLKTTTSGDIILDPASGTITLSNGDVIKTITGGPASRPVGEQILREVIPIFGFDLPARTASTTYVTVSRTIENYPFSSYLSGTTRVHKFIIRYANASATETTTWQVWNVTSGAQTSSFTVPASPGTSLDTGTVYITSAVIIPTNTDDWRVDVKVAAGDTIQIFEILLAAYDQVD